MQNRHEQALFRFSIIAPLINGTCEEKSIRNYALKASQKEYQYQGQSVKFSQDTIKRWYYQYQKSGYEGLMTVQRTDYQKPRVLTEETKGEIERLCRQYPKMSAAAIYQKLIAEQVLEREEASLKTVQRYVKSIRGKVKTDATERRRFQCGQPNDIFHG